MLPRVLSSFILVLCFAELVGAQALTSSTWQTFVSANGEFSVTLPATYMVFNDKRTGGVTIFGSAAGAYFDVSFGKADKSDDSFEELRKTASDKATVQEFKIGESSVLTYKLQDDQAVWVAVYVATNKGYYVVGASSTSSTSPALASILVSMRVGDQPVFKGTGAQDHSGGATIKVTSLKSSDLIRAAAKHKQTEKIEVQTGFDPPHRKRDKMYSRRVLIVSKPRAEYPEKARTNNITGSVKLRVELKANGNIGKITVVRELPFGLTEEAVRAASLIKFLPAEIFGQPTDVEVTIEYNFAIF